MSLRPANLLFASLIMGLNLAATEPAIVPQPMRMERRTGSFELTTGTSITFDGGEQEADKLAATLRAATGFELPVFGASSPDQDRGIALRLQTNRFAALGREGYELVVSPRAVVISAATETGLFYGGRSLLQLLPPEILSTNVLKHFRWWIPCVEIADQPRFRWRGLMLDCSRTFQSLGYLEQTLDRMALYKLNVLHLHLTDNQGWRIEIKKHPKLTQTGAFFSARHGEPPSHQGFYTQDQMRGLVAIAAERHITVVPEIEMPGHSHAALVCRPDLSCAGAVSEDIFPGSALKLPATEKTYCAGNEHTFQFLQDVLDEVVEVFPSQYIHVGGDEVEKTAWQNCLKCQERMKIEGLDNHDELQSYFIRRMEKHVTAKGRRLIGWDEILEGGLAPNATVMSWRGTAGAVAAATAGHDVILCPTSHCYLDYSYQVIDSARAFSFDPLVGIPPAAGQHVLGLQANFWSHLDREPWLVDRQLFPRLLALAERGWSPDNRTEWPAFQRRALAQLPRLAALGTHHQDQDLGERSSR